jgi:FlaG/FlaF family flagellin (archaellin)
VHGNFFAMAGPFLLWKEVKTNSFNPNEASTKQPTIENPNMKTITLMTAMFLTVAFAVPLAATTPANVRGYILATETSHPVGTTLLVDGSGSGSYTFGAFAVTYHARVDLTTGSARGSAQFTSPEGDTLSATFFGKAADTGIVREVYITELYTVTGGTGVFAGATGNFTVERLLDQAAGKTSGWFNGSIGLN